MNYFMDINILQNSLINIDIFMCVIINIRPLYVTHHWTLDSDKLWDTG